MRSAGVAHLPSLGHELLGGETTKVWHAWPMQLPCQPQGINAPLTVPIIYLIVLPPKVNRDFFTYLLYFVDCIACFIACRCIFNFISDISSHTTSQTSMHVISLFGYTLHCVNHLNRLLKILSNKCVFAYWFHFPVVNRDYFFTYLLYFVGCIVCFIACHCIFNFISDIFKCM